MIGIANKEIGIGVNTQPLDLKNLRMPTATNVNNLNLPQTPIAPVIPVSTTVKTSDLTKNATPQVIDNSGVIKNIQNTLAKYTAEAGANSDFVKGAIKASGQIETPELLAQYTGKKLGDVISGLGLGEKVGYTATPIAPVVPKATTTPVATSKVETAQTTPKTAYDYINDLDTQADAMQGNIDNAYKDAGVQAKAEEVNKLSGDLKMLDTNETVRNIMNNVEAQDLKDQYASFQETDVKNQGLTKSNAGVILGNKQDEINAKLQGLSSQEVRDLATYTLNRTNLAQQVQVAQGNYQIASDIAKQSVESMKWAFDKKMEIAKERGQITKDDADMAQQAFANEMSLAEKGYVSIPATDLAKVQADIASGKKDGTVFTNPITGQSYWKPATTELSELDIYAQKKAIDSLYEQGKITEADATTAKTAIVNDQKSVEQANTALTFIDEIFNDPMLGAVTGFSANFPTLRPESAGLVQKIDSLKSLLSLQNLGYLKGAMSDKDLVFIQSASSALNRKMTRKAFTNELDKIKTIMTRTKLKSGGYAKLTDYFQELNPAEQNNIVNIKKSTGISDEDLLKELQSEARGFNKVGGDTNTATLNKVVAKEDGTKGGQCGSFVNQITGLGLGDSYQSKMAKMDSSIRQPAPGMVFVMPYKDTGHTGFIVSVNDDGTATVKDSNYSLDEKVKTHKIALNKITGLAKV